MRQVCKECKCALMVSDTKEETRKNEKDEYYKVIVTKHSCLNPKCMCYNQTIETTETPVE